MFMFWLERDYLLEFLDSIIGSKSIFYFEMSKQKGKDKKGDNVDQYLYK